MNILVTGGSGYLGSHLVRTIIKNGDTPIVVDVNWPVFASSAAVYGDSEGQITEESPKEPISVYGRSKLMCEKIIEDFCNTHNFKFAILRFFNLCGRCSDIPFKRKSSMHLLDIADDVAKGKKEILNIFGGDYPTKDGSCLRDYVHVMDVVNAILSSLNLKTSTHLNIGSVHASVFDVLKNFDIPFRIVERRKGDPHTLLNVSNKAKEVLNWEPTYTTIEQIIESLKYVNFD